MDLDLSALVSMSQAQSQQQLQPTTPTVMHSLVMSSIPQVPPQHAGMLWSTTGEEFNGLALTDVMGLASHGAIEDTTGTTTQVTGTSHETKDNSSNHNINSISNNCDVTASQENLEQSQLQSQLDSHAHRSTGRKRGYSAVNDNAESEVDVSQEEEKTCSFKTEGERVYGETTTNDAGTSQLLCQLPSSVPTDIEPHVVCQMGGLAFAELCKERAREQFKERKKNEHLANGKFHRLKRRKKNDTSMSDKEKYVRRLQMNQDSAAAARYAHEVYIQVLEKLVKMSEEERGTFSMEMQRVRAQNEHLQSKVQELQAKVEELQAEEHGDPYADVKQTGPTFVNLMDLFKKPTSISVDYGVQPARAV